MSNEDSPVKKAGLGTSALDIAYACFIPFGLMKLIAGIAAYVRMGTGLAGGIGFLVLIPLMLVALIATPVGIYRAVVHREDRVLLFLAIATGVMLIQFFAELGSVQVQKLSGLAYGIVVFGIEASWFLVRRKRTSSSE